MNEVYEITGRELEQLRNALADAAVHTLSVAVDGGAKFKINGGSWTPSLGARQGLREAITQVLSLSPSPQDAMDIALIVRRSKPDLEIGALESWRELCRMERDHQVIRHPATDGAAVRWELVTA